MNLKTTDTPNTPISNNAELSKDTKGTPKEPLKVIVYVAASGDRNFTGAATIFRILHDNDGEKTEGKNWKRLDTFIELGYKHDGMMLEVLVDTIKKVAQNTPEEDRSRLEFDCKTIAKNIVRGFNKQREAWQASGYINRLGNHIDNEDLWEELFALSDTYKVTIGEPKGHSKVIRACVNRAKKAIDEGVFNEWR